MRYLIFILACASAWGQVESYGHKANADTKVDMSAALSSRPVPEKASDPATCTEGMRYYNTTSHKGRICTGTNTWTDETGSGSGNMSITTQAGAPSGACTAGSGWVLDTTAQEFYSCSVSGTWKRILTTIDSGTSVVGMLEGTAPGAGAASGVHNLYFDSADHKLKSHVNGGSVVTYYSSFNPQASVSGSAATLATPRAIYGNNFDGSAALTQVIASTYGGTGNGFTKFTGPTTAERTFTLPDASSTLLYSGGPLGTPSSGTLTNATGLPTAGMLDAAVTPAKASTAMKRDAIGVAVGDPAGSALATGVLGYVVVPNACTIAGWDIVVDAGTATVDVWKVGTGTAKPTVSNTITASAKPAISTGTVIHSTTLTGWTTSVTAFDVIGFNLDTVATAKYITVQLFCDRQ